MWHLYTILLQSRCFKTSLCRLGPGGLALPGQTGREKQRYWNLQPGCWSRLQDILRWWGVRCTVRSVSMTSRPALTSWFWLIASQLGSWKGNWGYVKIGQGGGRRCLMGNERGLNWLWPFGVSLRCWLSMSQPITSIWRPVRLLQRLLRPLMGSGWL